MPLGADDHGNLYGTTAGGGDKGASSRGTVFELTPPAPGQTRWSEKILWTFLGPDGAAPAGGLIADARGNLYGTTETGGANGNNGTVFELTPAGPQQTQWSEQVLWSFSGGSDGGIPFAGLIMDRRGNLYGTTFLGGAVYDDGTAFELMPPARGGTQWSERVLWALADSRDGAEPKAGLIADAKGNLYGTASVEGPNGGGTAFKMTP